MNRIVWAAAGVLAAAGAAGAQQPGPARPAGTFYQVGSTADMLTPKSRDYWNTVDVLRRMAPAWVVPAAPKPAAGRVAPEAARGDADPAPAAARPAPFGGPWAGSVWGRGGGLGRAR